jgi:uncharacterized protein YjbJ (UPF0337 family)
MDIARKDSSVPLSNLPHQHEPDAVARESIHVRSTTMKSGTKDKLEGKFHEAKGKLKEVAGQIAGKPKLEAEGTNEHAAGKVQEKVGQIKTVLGK